MVHFLLQQSLGFFKHRLLHTRFLLFSISWRPGYFGNRSLPVSSPTQLLGPLKYVVFFRPPYSSFVPLSLTDLRGAGKISSSIESGRGFLIHVLSADDLGSFASSPLTLRMPVAKRSVTSSSGAAITHVAASTFSIEIYTSSVKRVETTKGEIHENAHYMLLQYHMFPTDHFLMIFSTHIPLSLRSCPNIQDLRSLVEHPEECHVTVLDSCSQLPPNHLYLVSHPAPTPNPKFD